MYLQRWHSWCHVKLLPSWRVLCTPYNYAPCHFTQSHIRKVRARLAVTCHQLHCWQSDRVVLRATQCGSAAGWNGYRNKSQHRKLTRRTENFSRSSCRDSIPWPFNHESGAQTTELSPLHIHTHLKPHTVLMRNINA